ncbi:MAG: carboxypeptidase regulatory-like domain-containing protein [Bacteroidota bacterium]
MSFSKLVYAALGACPLVLIFSVLSVHAQYKAVTVSDGGAIAGKVKFVGTPTIEKLEVGKDTRHCGTAKTSPRLSVDKAEGVKNAVVMLIDIEKGKAVDVPPKAVIDQKGCEYIPHVQAVSVGTQLEVVNSDAILHNVHGYNPQGRTLFNIAQPIKGQRTSSKRMRFQEPGVYSFACDAGHIWMSAFVVAVEHPYFAVTDEKGTFKIENVPAGTYKIKMWHEGFKITKKNMRGGKVVKYHYEEPYEEIKKVTVEPKSVVTLDFELKPREE